MLCYEEGAKIPVFGYRNGREVMLRKAIAGKSPRDLYEEGLTERYALQTDGTWLLVGYHETED